MSPSPARPSSDQRPRATHAARIPAPPLPPIKPGHGAAWDSGAAHLKIANRSRAGFRIQIVRVRHPNQFESEFRIGHVHGAPAAAPRPQRLWFRLPAQRPAKTPARRFAQNGVTGLGETGSAERLSVPQAWPRLTAAETNLLAAAARAARTHDSIRHWGRLLRLPWRLSCRFPCTFPGHPAVRARSDNAPPDLSPALS